jgi:hypothetical protein
MNEVSTIAQVNLPTRESMRPAARDTVDRLSAKARGLGVET